MPLPRGLPNLENYKRRKLTSPRKLRATVVEFNVSPHCIPPFTPSPLCLCCDKPVNV